MKSVSRSSDWIVELSDWSHFTTNPRIPLGFQHWCDVCKSPCAYDFVLNERTNVMLCLACFGESWAGNYRGLP